MSTEISKEARPTCEHGPKGWVCLRCMRKFVEEQEALSSVKEPEAKPEMLERCHSGGQAFTNELRSEAPTTQEQSHAETGEVSIRDVLIGRAVKCSTVIQNAISEQWWHEAHEAEIRRGVWLDAANLVESLISTENHNAVGSSVDEPKAQESAPHEDSGSSVSNIVFCPRCKLAFGPWYDFQGGESAVVAAPTDKQVEEKEKI